MGVGGGWGVLTWASGYNFPLFLVYPVDMPGYLFCVCECVCERERETHLYSLDVHLSESS